MKKFFQYFENLWVTITYAEAGEYDLIQHETQPDASDPLYVEAS